MVDTLDLKKLAVRLDRCWEPVSVGRIVRKGVPPFAGVGEALAERINGLSEKCFESGGALLYQLPEPSKVPDVWAAGCVTAHGSMSWGQLTRLLSKRAVVGPLLPAGARVACQMHDQHQQTIAVMVKIGWGKDGQGQHFAGLARENDPNFSWYDNTVFLIRTQ